MTKPAEHEDEPLAQTIELAVRPRRAAPGFVKMPREATEPLGLSPSFIDRCRQAFLSIEFDGPSRVVGVSGVGPSDSRTMIAAGIATAMAADTGETTVLVEVDFDHPHFKDVFRIPEGAGLGDWLEDAARLRILPMTPLPNAFVIPAGTARDESGHLFYRLTQSTLMEELRGRFKNIVVDLPAIRNITHSSLASSLCDHVLMVARYGITPVDELQQAVYLLGQERLAGIVVSGYAPRSPRWLRRLF